MKHVFALLTVVLAVCAMWLLTASPNPTFPLIPLIPDVTRLWGTYRPANYFGIRTRSPHTLLGGLMWMGVEQQSKAFGKVRHTCEEGDGLGHYAWKRHDGRFFAEQSVLDGANNANLTMVFVKSASGRDWAVRIRAESLHPVERQHALSLVWYMGSAMEGGAGGMQFDSRPRRGVPHDLTKPIEWSGVAPETGQFRMRIGKRGNVSAFEPYSGAFQSILPDPNGAHWATWAKEGNELWTVQRSVEQQFGRSFGNIRHEVGKLHRTAQHQGKPAPNVPEIIVPTLMNQAEASSNLLAVQITQLLPFEIEVVLLGSRDADFASWTGDALDSTIDAARDNFTERFDAAFPAVQPEHRRMAETAFSNLLGGMGYWHGSSIIHEGTDKEGKDVLSKGRSLPLYSAVPSRSFFPRGFLWDEGFHQLLVTHFDERIAMDALSHWYNVMHEDGWIPREQILGAEAESKVPEKFQAQHREHANPPTLLLVLQRLLQHSAQKGDQKARVVGFVRAAWPRLQRHYNWWAKTQAGMLDHSFRWRGRTVNHTLSCGLDDYPREAKPNAGELHLDGLCWMIFFGRTMASLAEVVGESGATYAQDAVQYTTTLQERHWDSARNLFADANARNDKYRSPHVGYVTLFPLMLGVLEPGSAQLDGIAEALADPKQLWTEFGIRSLSRSDPYYGTGENYWKGAIWINMNYLVLSSIHTHYAKHHKGLADIYVRLRNNLINNIQKEFDRTGYFWEQYDPDNGHGKRSHPFTGWTSLIVDVLSETYV